MADIQAQLITLCHLFQRGFLLELERLLDYCLPLKPYITRYKLDQIIFYDFHLSCFLTLMWILNADSWFSWACRFKIQSCRRWVFFQCEVLTKLINMLYNVIFSFLGFEVKWLYSSCLFIFNSLSWWVTLVELYVMRIFCCINWSMYHLFN